MDGLARRWAADAVTASRVPIGLAMLLVRRRRIAAGGLFVAGVITDVIDGPLARRFGTASPRGARLDSAADAVFVAAAIAVVATRLDHSSRRTIIGAAGAVAATRLAALLATRLRFGSWSVMHTHLNKATGLGLACVAGATLLRGRMPMAATAAVAAVAEAAAIEELAILLVVPDYDADRPSLFA